MKRGSSKLLAAGHMQTGRLPPGQVVFWIALLSSVLWYVLLALWQLLS